MASDAGVGVGVVVHWFLVESSNDKTTIKPNKIWKNKKQNNKKEEQKKEDTLRVRRPIPRSQPKYQ
ncbi:unnamed protein product [Anisakis simplex]|uniref:Uncharacterized protein n=1 Tax=Anisakis simplex TaxID=6269 RepID=A0A0M3JBQ7_ANISI|nr:unnamed protein product [Anisakis simplex]